MNKLVIFCKSYAKDMWRARRMAASVQRYNEDHIPLYISVPEQELSEFKSCFADIPCHFLTDQQILARCEAANGERPWLFPGHLLQQLIKLEFWRMELCENYVWIDSDAYFIRPFKITTFLHNGDVPYTVQHDNRDLLNFAEQTGNRKIKTDFEDMATKFKALFGRTGPLYSFASPPLIWGCKVLRNLNEVYLTATNQTIYKLLEDYPCEMHLYGEYLHYCQVIPLVAHRELFKVYHYAEQFFLGQEHGEAELNLAEHYYGVIMQSNWAKLPDHPRPTDARLKHFFRKAMRQTRDLFLPPA